MLRALLLLVLLAPAARAVETLDDLEEPHEGVDKVWEVTVSAEQAGAPRALVYRNAPRSPFGLVVYDQEGAEIFAKNGTRGVQTLPALEAGTYRFFVRGSGAFQVTHRALDGTAGARVVEATLAGTDAYVFVPRQNATVSIGGDVRVEWWDLTGGPEQLEAPTARTAGAGGVVVMTIRGDDGASYLIETTTGAGTTPEPGSSSTPGAPVVAFLALALALALSLKRRT